MGFVANSYAFQQCKNFENRLRFDKVTESLKVGTFLRHSVQWLKLEWSILYTGRLRQIQAHG